MPLKDLFSKAPNRLPPSEEPWPKPSMISPQQEASQEEASDYRLSPLYSATSRPTLDEFLRTNYLMIPEFLAQVNQEKKAAGIVENEHCVQNITCQQQSGLNDYRNGTPALISSDRNQGVDYSTNKTKDLEEKQTAANDVESKACKVSDKLSAGIFGRQITSDEKRPLVPQKPKQRVKKVMKGGSLVTIPAPKPRKRPLSGVEGSSDDNSKPATSFVLLESSKCGKAVDMLKRKNLEETVGDISRNEASGIQSEVKDDLHTCTFLQDDGDLQKKVPTKGSKQPQSDCLAEKHEENSVSLNTKHSDHNLTQGKSNKIDISWDSFQDLSSDTCTSKSRISSNNKESDILCNKDTHKALTKKPDGKISAELTDDPNPTIPDESSISEAVCKEHDGHPGRISPSCKEDSQQPKINKEPVGKDDDGLSCRDYHDLLEPLSVAYNDSGINRTVAPHDLHIVTSNQMNSNQSNKDKFQYAKESSESQETHRENNKHISSGDVETSENSADGCGVSGSDVMNTDVENSDAFTTLANDNKKTAVHGEAIVNNDELNVIVSNDVAEDVDGDGETSKNSADGCGVSGSDVMNADVENSDAITTQANDNKKMTDNDGAIVNNDVAEDVNGDEGNGGSDDGGDSVGDGGGVGGNGGGDDCDGDGDGDGDDHGKVGGDIGIKGNSSAEESDEDYAELVMDDSTSDEEEEDYFVPANEDDSDEEEGEVKSDYEAEDMNLDSDTESTVGGITFVQDTTLSKRRKRARKKQRAKRKAKNQKKKASKKRAKVEKQEKQTHTPISRKSPLKEGTKNLRPETPKSTETLPKPQIDTMAAQNKPSGQGALEEGSLLSMVSSYAVDVTVAASEKLALKRSRGGQHAKKLKKAKRKAAALERIKRGEPPPRPRSRVQQPKPLCNFYIQGKCRKGEECPFRHDKSAVIKKRELCKYYVSNSCYLGNDCLYMHSSFPCKFFHTGSSCWEGDRCKFSHDPLTEETSRLLRTLLNPLAEDPVELAQDKSLGNVDGKTQETNANIGQMSPSSPYNLRASARKRRLSASEAGGDHVIGEKSSRQESPEQDSEANIQGQSSLFLPGLYKDLSM